MAAGLHVDGLSKSYGTNRVVDDLHLEIEEGELVALLGPSGCGKTTTLRMIAGFLRPDGGQIVLNDKVINHMPPYRRNIGMVFQSYALFPHMTVFDNVAYGLKERRRDNAEIQRRVAEALAMVHLTGYEQRRPRELSGGQQQRVALARALVIEPDLLLLDEPLSNLDAKLRHEVRLEIKQLQKALGLTTLLVTHDQEEALSMASRVAVMKDGRIEQVGTPAEIYQQPESAFVADFIGTTNLVPAQVAAAGAEGILCRIGRSLSLTIPGQPSQPSGQVMLSVRPEQLRLIPAGAHGEPAQHLWPGRIVEATYLGAVSRYQVAVDEDLTLTIDAGNGPDQLLPAGQEVWVDSNPEAWRLLHR